jgi:hypothetical protein
MKTASREQLVKKVKANRVKKKRPLNAVPP